MNRISKKAAALEISECKVTSREILKAKVISEKRVVENEPVSSNVGTVYFSVPMWLHHCLPFVHMGMISLDALMTVLSLVSRYDVSEVNQ